MSKDAYVPLLVAALVVLILGCWNPKIFQKHHHGKPSGQPSYMWIAALSLLAGLLACYFMGDSVSSPLYL